MPVSTRTSAMAKARILRMRPALLFVLFVLFLLSVLRDLPGSRPPPMISRSSSSYPTFPGCLPAYPISPACLPVYPVSPCISKSSSKSNSSSSIVGSNVGSSIYECRLCEIPAPEYTPEDVCTGLLPPFFTSGRLCGVFPLPSRSTDSNSSKSISSKSKSSIICLSGSWHQYAFLLIKPLNIVMNMIFISKVSVQFSI